MKKMTGRYVQEVHVLGCDKDGLHTPVFMEYSTINVLQFICIGEQKCY